MKIKNYTTMNLSETFCSLKTIATALLLGVLLLSNNTVIAQNNALDFDGVDDYVSLPATINDQITTNNVTIEGWFNIESIGDEVTLVGEFYDGGADQEIKFAIYHDTDTESIVAIFLNGSNFPFASSPTPALNNWVHIAATFDGTNVRLYFNGAQVGVSADTTISLPASNNGIWVLGRRTDVLNPVDQFKGKMDEVRIWNTTRSAAEILANYKKQVADNSAGLIAYYKMNQGVAEANNTAITSLTNSSTIPSLGGTFNGFALTGTSSNFVTGIPTVYDAGWSQGTPDATTDAIIEGNYNVAGNFSAKTLTVTNSAVVTIPSGTNVTVAGAVTVIAPATFTLSNNANLIQVNNVGNTGDITVNRNSNPLFRLDYTLWSSPVTGQNLLTFSPLTSTNRFYDYDTNSSKYTAVLDPSTTAFVAGKGNLIRMPNTNALAGYDGGTAQLTYNGTFTGVPNNGNVQVTLSGFGNRYNLVGNPYPSTIDADAFIDQNEPSVIESTIYFWRKKNDPLDTSTAYATYNLVGGVGPGVGAGSGVAGAGSEVPNGTIQVGQGFFVQAKFATTVGTFFTNSMRLPSSSTQFFKTKKVVNKDRIWLNLTSTSGVLNQMLVGYLADATAGLDRYDGKYINDAAIALTSNINNEEYTIQGRPAFDASDVVPLNFKTNVAGDYSIAIDHVDGLFSGSQDIYLLDSKTGAETNLKEGAYNFNATAGVDNARFSLKYQKTLKVDVPVFNQNSIKVYSKNGNLYVNVESITIKNIKVFDIQGRLVAQQNNVKANTATISNVKANQALIVQVTSEDNIVVNKKVVN